MFFEQNVHEIVGKHGSLRVDQEDEVSRKLAMLIEGECECRSAVEVAERYGYTKQRYYQIRQAFITHGSCALANRKSGPKRNYRRTNELVRQVIRHRFLDPKAAPDVIAQKLRQTGFSISTRSVERVISNYGLQKKTL